LKLEDLPEEMQEEIVALKHGAYTIECDVNDALEQAENISDFKETVRIRMKDLIGEAQGIITDFCGDVRISPVSSKHSFAQVLCDVQRVLVDAGFKDMGAVQTMPGSTEDIQRFLRDLKELVEVSYTDELNGNENTTQITRSKWVSKTKLCSPCYPGQGDLNNSGEYLVYTLPPSIWGNHDHLQISELSAPLETIRKMYTSLFDTDLDTKDFAEDFFYIVGNILNGKTLEEIFGSSEMSPRGPAAGTLRMILENKGINANEDSAVQPAEEDYIAQVGDLVRIKKTWGSLTTEDVLEVADVNELFDAHLIKRIKPKETIRYGGTRATNLILVKRVKGVGKATDCKTHTIHPVDKGA
jgi:hypothetical protein